VSATVSLFVCQGCGHRSAKWLGRCPECEAWSSFVEEAGTRSRSEAKAPRTARAVALSEIESDAVARAPSGLAAVDRVLGGGVVAGSAVLLAGEPGIKSTLLQLADRRQPAPPFSTPVPRSRRGSPAARGQLGRPQRGSQPAGSGDRLGRSKERSPSAPEIVLIDSIQALRVTSSSAAQLDGQVRHAAGGWWR
jgi:DNA repair protein RadA/Sms